jgi:NAD(P)-dependent dehydrogenase (short-subunit alcohol dehydrogenase family)
VVLLIITARTPEKGQAAIDDIKKFLSETVNVEYTTEEQTLSYKILDFSDLSAIKSSLQNDWNDVTSIDVLLNNAGAYFSKRILTVDGFESTIQTNHLGYFVVSALLFPKLSTNARIINVSSSAHSFVSKNGLNFDNLWKADKKDEKDFSTFYAYGESKLANIMFTEELQRRLSKSTASKEISTVSLHPGAIQTDLARTAHETMVGRFIVKVFGFFATLGMVKTVENGTATHVWLSSTPTITNEMKGKYFVDCKVAKVTVKTPEPDCVRLWEESEQMTSIKFLVP